MAGEARKILTGCLVAVGAFVLVLVLLLVAYGAWGAYANHRAEAAAERLCAGIRPGDRIEAVSRKAAASEPPARAIHDGDRHTFTYFGMIFSARECEVSTRDGRVTAKRVIVFDD
jgi:hypothetical protein